MSSTVDMEHLVWQSYADACVEHDARHARRAAAEVDRLRQVPAQRTRTRTGGRTLAS